MKVSNPREKPMFVGTLQKGDPIVVTTWNRLNLGIFKKYNPKGNPHYYTVSEQRLNRYKQLLSYNKTVYVDFINRPAGTSIAKIDLKEVDYDLRMLFDETKLLLEQKGAL